MKDLTRNGMLVLNMNTFGEDDNPKPDDVVDEGVLKFGNVDIPMEGLSEETKTLMSKAQGSYTASRQQVSDLETEKNKVNQELKDYKHANPIKKEVIAPVDNQKQLNPDTQSNTRLNAVEINIANMAIENYKNNEMPKMIATMGKENADEIMSLALKEFNTRHLKVEERTTDMLNSYIKYYIGVHASKPVEGRFNINNNADFAKMIGSEIYKDKLNAYQNAQSGQGNPAHMVGTNNTLKESLNSEEIKKEVSPMTREERKAKMFADIGRDQRQTRDNNFIIGGGK